MILSQKLQFSLDNQVHDIIMDFKGKNIKLNIKPKKNKKKLMNFC